MITLKINTAMNGYKKGSTISLQTDDNGNILDSFWARRLKDSEIDNCVSIVNPVVTLDSEEKTKKGNK